MAETTMTGMGNIDQVFSYLDRTILAHATSCEAVGTHGCIIGGGRVILRVYEKYYMRNSSRASLTVLLTEQEGAITVKIVGSGGGSGALIRYSWGAEEEFAGVAINALQQAGFMRM